MCFDSHRLVGHCRPRAKLFPPMFAVPSFTLTDHRNTTRATSSNINFETGHCIGHKKNLQLNTKKMVPVIEQAVGSRLPAVALSDNSGLEEQCRFEKKEPPSQNGTGVNPQGASIFSLAPMAHTARRLLKEDNNDNNEGVGRDVMDNMKRSDNIAQSTTENTDNVSDMQQGPEQSQSATSNAASNELT